MAEQVNYLQRKKRPKPIVLVAIVLFHIVVLYGLAKALVPEFTGGVEDSVVEAFTVTITTPDEEMPEAQPEPDEGAQGDPGERATPKPTTAPIVPRPDPKPAPQASSTGTQNRSGARESGDGTGAAGSGPGTGSGRGGGGTGNGAVTKPTVKSGSISAARDFPVPEGGRSARAGTSVTVAFTVGVDGRASGCSVLRAGPFPETNARVCPLVVERIRFNPARDAQGNPVPARYGWKQEFFN